MALCLPPAPPLNPQSTINLHMPASDLTCFDPPSPSQPTPAPPAMSARSHHALSPPRTTRCRPIRASPDITRPLIHRPMPIIKNKKTPSASSVGLRRSNVRRPSHSSVLPPISLKPAQTPAVTTDYIAPSEHHHRLPQPSLNQSLRKCSCSNDCPLCHKPILRKGVASLDQYTLATYPQHPPVPIGIPLLHNTLAAVKHSLSQTVKHSFLAPGHLRTVHCLPDSCHLLLHFRQPFSNEIQPFSLHDATLQDSQSLIELHSARVSMHLDPLHPLQHSVISLAA